MKGILKNHRKSNFKGVSEFLYTNTRLEVLYYITLILFTGLVGYLSLLSLFSLEKGIDFNTYTNFTSDFVAGFRGTKSIQENGLLGIWFDGRIGAPETSALICRPGTDYTKAIIIWIIAHFTRSTPKIVYIFLILTFVFDGVGMSILLRKLKVKREIAFVFSSLFAFAPYHFYRYILHLALAEYSAVPLAIYLAFCILGIIKDEKKWKMGLCIIWIGLGWAYYYAFGFIVLAVAYLVDFIKLENKREIIKKIGIGGLLLVTVAISLLPTWVYSFINGENGGGGVQRYFWEQEIYGLKIINLLLPVSYSRIEKFRNLTQSYIESGALSVTENSWANLGLIGSVGFIILCAMMIVSFVKKKESRERFIIDFCALTTLIFVLLGTIGGFGEIFNWAVTSIIRCYNRASIYILCFAFIAIAVLLNQIKYKKKILLFLMCFIILGVGCFDQIGIPKNQFPSSGIKQSQEIYERYFAQVENQLDEGAMVYQLPYLDYPEVSATYDYQHFIAYLFTDKLRWSYGGIKGINMAASELNQHDGMSYAFLLGLQRAGFQAVYIDVNGYQDKEQSRSILKFYDSLDIAPIVSEDKRFYVYDISGLEIPEALSQPESFFIHKWAGKYNIDISQRMVIDLARGFYNADTVVYETLYGWMSSAENVSNMEDDDYIKYLYESLLGREADEAGAEGYMRAIQDGTPREEIFYSFLNSEEFRAKERLNNSKIPY